MFVIPPGYPQIMSEAYSCTFDGCGMVFSRGYELKKHMVTHEDPNRLFYCPDCDFITLQKKNLRIHRSTHTGEKTHQCPDMVELYGSPESPPSTERCEYRTHDPAALTKHRKKVHGYIPPLSRSGPAKAALRKRHQKKEGKITRHPHPPQGTLRRKPSRVVRQLHNAISGAGYISTPSESSEDPSPVFCPEIMQSMGSDTSDASGYDSTPSGWRENVHRQSTDATCSEVSSHDSSPFLWQGDIDAYGQLVKTDAPFMYGFDPSTLGDAASPHQKMEQHSLYDSSLYSQWMAMNKGGYSTLDQTRLSYRPEPVQAIPPLIPTSLLMSSGQAGYLCPEWMAETGLGDLLDAPDQFCVFQA